MKKLITILVLLIPILLPAQEFNSNKENLFLHTDRNMYISGDEIYFKAYAKVESTGSPSYISQSFYVALADTSGNVIKKVRFPLRSSIGHGNLTIPATLKQGVYSLIAYTSFMQNFDPEDCFIQSIRIEDEISFIEGSNSLKKDDRTRLTTAENIDIQLLAEGGNLVAGLKNNVGLCAVTEKGIPLKLTLILADENNNVLDTIYTNMAGLGKFNISPESDIDYHVSIIDPPEYGSKTVSLPKSLKEGIGLRLIENTKNHLSIVLRSTSKHTEHIKIQMAKNGNLLCSRDIELNGIAYPELTFDNTGSGIGTLTVFKEEEPVAERLVFLDSDRRLNITCDLEYGAYPARGKMNLNIKVSDQLGIPVKAFLSAAIVDSINCIASEFTRQDIRYSFWLRSNLKRNTPVSVPMMVLNRIGMGDSDLISDIDLLLLTYGWRKYNPGIADSTLINYDNIRGYTTTINRRKEKNSIPNLVVYEPSTRYAETIYPDSGGRFDFRPKFDLFDKQLMWNFGNIKMGKKWKISFEDYENYAYVKRVGSIKTYDSAAPVSFIETEPIEYFDMGIFMKYIKIPEVTVKRQATDRTKDRARLANSIQNIGTFRNGSSEDIKDLPDLESIINRIQPPSRIIKAHPIYGYPVFRIYFRSSDPRSLRGTSPSALFVVNDVPIDPLGDGLEVEYMPPEMIDRVSIIKGPQAFAFFGAKALGGAVMIYTKNPEDIHTIHEKDPGLLFTLPLCNTVKEFYKPNYTDENIDLDRADYRLTLHWEPDLIIDSNGENTIEYYNAGYNSYVTGIIQGMSITGEPVSHRFRYRVVKE